jgi:Ran GTPase-activating protein (RanGAP) involved in mRNA processing and transport
MEGNSLHETGAKQLVDALSKNKSLRTLNLASNFIKDEGCQALCFFLLQPTCQLKEINL